MQRVDVSLQAPLAALLEAAVDEGMFTGTSDAARVATREYYTSNDDSRQAAVQALVDAAAAEDTEPEEIYSLADVVRLSDTSPEDLPPDVRAHYGVRRNANQDTSASESDP